MYVCDYIVDDFTNYNNEWSLTLFNNLCNLDCVYCYSKKHLRSMANNIDAIDLINSKITKLHTAVTLLGGEPLMAPLSDIIKLAQLVKEKGLKLKVFTNGTMYNEAKTLCEMGLVSAFSVDFKCIKNCSDVLGVDVPDIKYIPLVSNTIHLIQDYKLPVEIRTVTPDWLIDQKHDILQYCKINFGIEPIFTDDMRKPYDKMLNQDLRL